MELVQACFRVLVVVLRDVGSHSLSSEQLRVLVTFIAADIGCTTTSNESR